MSNVRLDVVEGEKVLVPHPHVPGPAPNSAPWVHFYVMEAPDEARSFLPTGGPPSAPLAPGRTTAQKPGGGGGYFGSPPRLIGSDVPAGRCCGRQGPGEDIFSAFVLLKAPEVQGPWNPLIP